MGLLSASMDPQVGISPEKQTVKMILQDYKVKTTSYGKNFAIVGALFAAIECNIESVSNNFLSHKILFLLICEIYPYLNYPDNKFIQ